MKFLGLFTRHQPKIKVASTKKDGFSGWVKCTKCEEMIHANQLQDNHNCCPKCDHHYRLSAVQRVELLADDDTFQELFSEIEPTNPLKFVDTEDYDDRLKRARKKTGRNEGILVGTCTIEKMPVALGALDFSFMGGSMGSVVGERITLLIEHAIKHKLPVILVSSSGGARMQESIFSLMQMAKTSAALAKLSEARLPYISVLANPTTGGVTASFASLGDLIIAEPDALIGFAGPRVVEQTIGQKLPDSAQKSEFLLEKGMIDCIVRRVELKEKLAFFLNFLMDNKIPLVSKKEMNLGVGTEREKLDDLIALSRKEREKNAIKVTSE
ncbi:MAG: acetyl-CoA carboxylase carboxyltransferase subunit beta [Simkania sp.]|jgi:acetyl-CoA carboxylase carboxyl transferase subunit beta|uniref:Acetyl-coenzyme A carboxylase carboxyl transferase subunit beta n=1 Tax=Simkania negevensis (strain ATCC VR-1471 / DSM 27360 / Z) TaxID=331113 RepID=F8L6H8_SIMNZ|nr:acetyl-CoA carboxylase, carboxyltransferase subunit beta [Simkania negevensis]MCB1074545.1 acetyl-CoA carboxylase carboxyltransferase subunit beta [Simkania sp.]MCB1109599.1 acetyl-CoA carboxylase carboxyltransferase subunit beta [Chlamydiia bacterium]MCP5490042.1 acetyl-CoA carboxylase carboxyltransferase subunit beta [Chlamydiales bacterium]MCB1083980.1 acetyl-CoA carboxylase carboxyltransferase subunit beta [Simkania sp.]CCB88315.1 acetyl-coenzyme A carboxylase carboxyl transferase subun